MFLVFVFVCCVAFISVLFALFLFCCWIVFGVGSCFAFVFVFLFFSFVFCSCFFLFFCSVFFGGFKGQVRATSLGPKPSLFFCFCFFVVLFCLFFGGFKGQVRWPKGPPHLALNPPYFLFVLFWFLFFLCFPFFVFFLIDKNTCFSPQKGAFLFIFQCLPLFLFSSFGASPLNFPFSCFVSLLLFSFFLPSYFSLSLSGSCYFFFLCLLLCFKMFFCFCCSACCLVMFWIITFHLFLLCILFSGCCCCCCFFVLLALLFVVFLIFGNLSKNISEKWKLEKQQTWKMQKKKTDILTRVVSTVVFTNCVFFLFCVSFNFAFVAENTIKIGVSAKQKKKTNKILKLKSGPS